MRTTLAAMALLVFAQAHSAIETRTVRIEFKKTFPVSTTTWGPYAFQDAEELLQVNPWGGYHYNQRTIDFETDGSFYYYKTLNLLGGAMTFGTLDNSFSTDWSTTKTIRYPAVSEGFGAGLRIDPVYPNSSRRAIRIKRVEGRIHDALYDINTVPTNAIASFGNTPTINRDNRTFVWTAGNETGSSLGLYFIQDASLTEITATIDIVTGEDITDSDLSSSYDDLYTQKFPKHLYSEALVPASTAGGGSKYRVAYQHISHVDDQPSCDVVTDNFECQTSDGMMLTTSWVVPNNNGGRFTWSPFYPDGKYSSVTFTENKVTNRRNEFKARITRDKEGKVTTIREAKIYFCSAAKPKYSTYSQKWECNDGAAVLSGYDGYIAELGTDANGQYVLWRASGNGATEVGIQFRTRQASGNASSNTAYLNWSISDWDVYRVIKYVELTFNTVNGTSSRPALQSRNGEYTLSHSEAMTYSQANGALRVKSGSNYNFYVLSADADITLPYTVKGQLYTQVASNATRTYNGSTITLPSSARYAEVLLMSTDASGRVQSYTKNRLINTRMTVRTLDELENRYYTWTDIDGNRHTSKITDKTTDPLQALSLIKEVYNNPWYPGTIWHDPVSYKHRTLFPQGTGYYYANTWEDTMQRLINASSPNTVYELGWPTEGNTLIALGARSEMTDYRSFKAAWKAYETAYNNGTSESFTSPLFHYGDLANGHGYSRKWNPTLVRFNEIYKSAQIVPGIKRIESTDQYNSNTDYNPGSLFMFSGEYNRFYFLSKGRFRGSTHPGGYSDEDGVAEPYFRHMYEEIAPVTENLHTANVYSALMSGIEPVVEHDCETVPGRDHWFQMRSTGEAQRLDNMTIFLPDYRNYFGVNDQDETMNFYSGYRPYMGLYTVQLEAEASLAGELGTILLDGGQTVTKYAYDIHPSWVTTMSRLEEKTGVAGAADEEFQLYVQTLDPVTGDYSAWTLINGPQQSLFWDKEHTYQVEQQAEAQYFNYRVYARLRGTSSEWVLSNEASVVVPGYDVSQLIILPVDIAHRSDFHAIDDAIDGEKNHYKNHLTLLENSPRPMLANFMDEGTVLTVMRMHGHDHVHGQPIKFCTVTITSKQTDSDGRIRFGYRLDYFNQEPNGSQYLQPELYAPQTGHFTAASANSLVHFGNGFYMLDQFSETVNVNEHCPHHDYYLTFECNGVTYMSNRVRVNVYQTNFTASTFGYSEEQVNDDTDAALPAERTAYMTVEVEEHSNIQEYVALRNGQTRVSTAQRGATGAYTTFKADKDGKVSVVMDREHAFTEPVGSSMTLQLQDSIRDNDPGNRWYVAKIEVLTPNLPGSLPAFYNSTYGSHRTVVDNPEVKVYDPYLEKSDPRNSDGLVDYRAQLRISATNLSSENAQEAEPHLYRVWRYEDDKEPVLLNTLEDRNYGKGESRHNTGYSQLNNPPKERVSDDEEGDLTMIINDHILAPQLQAGQTKKIRYVVRFYARLKAQADDDDTPYPAPRRTPAAANGQIAEFCVSEQEINVLFDNSVVTGVTTVKTDTGAQVEQVTYVNALGQQSSKPWPGVNIVVTTYDNGVRMSEKRVF